MTGFEIREHVRFAECVDGLLGIPDKEDGGLLCKGRSKDVELLLIRILELIYEYRFVFTLQGEDQLLVPVLAYSNVKLVYQVVIGQVIGSFLECPDLVGDVLQRVIVQDMQHKIAGIGM